MPHIHISTEFAVAVMAGGTALTVAIIALRNAAKKARMKHEEAVARIKQDFDNGAAYLRRGIVARTVEEVPSYHKYGAPDVSAADVEAVERHYAPRPSGIGYVHPSYSSPAAGYAQPIYYHNSGSDMLTGMLIGEAIAGNHHDTVIERDHYVDSTPSYSPSFDNSPSYTAPDSTPSYDSGGSSFDSGSSSSFDSGSSGGFDVSW